MLTTQISWSRPCRLTRRTARGPGLTVNAVSGALPGGDMRRSVAKLSPAGNEDLRASDVVDLRSAGTPAR
jgi:hypothetical protein